MNSNRTVVITGANGYVGRNVGKFLSENGFHVICLARKGKEKSLDFS